MAIVIMAIFSYSFQSIQGALFLSIAHGITSPGLFICAGILYDRFHTRTIIYYRGITIYMPLFSIIFFIFTLANMATPLTGNFIGEYLCFLGIFNQNPILAILASLSIILVAAYSIWFYNRVVFGSYSLFFKPTFDLTYLEFSLLLPLLLSIIFLGIFPNILLDIVEFSLSISLPTINI